LVWGQSKKANNPVWKITKTKGGGNRALALQTQGLGQNQIFSPLPSKNQQ
jgi:hypothetical protein